LKCTPTLLLSPKLGALPQPEPPKRTSPRGHISLHTSASDSGFGQISQISPRGSIRSVRSLGKGFARKPGIVNSRIQHFEGRIQEVVSRATLPDGPYGSQQLTTRDAHSPLRDHFHALQRAVPSPRATKSPRGETRIITTTSTPHIAVPSPPWSPHAATTVQRLSSHSQKTSESPPWSPRAASTVQRLSSQGQKTSESMVQRQRSIGQKASEPTVQHDSSHGVHSESSHGQAVSESNYGSTGSTYVSSTGLPLEASHGSFTITGNQPPISSDQDFLDSKQDVSSKTRSKEEPQLRLPPSNPGSVCFTQAANAASNPHSPTCTGLASTIEKLKAAII